MSKRDDPLEEPVHVVLLKNTKMDDLRRKYDNKKENPKHSLPKEKVSQKESFNPYKIPNIQNVSSVVKKANTKTKLQVLYNHIPPFPEDKEPPCDECKTAACCKAFVVSITKEEYESGVFGDYAVKLDKKDVKHIKNSQILLPSLLSVPQIYTEDYETSYLLEGRIGEYCPFLDENMLCSIYEDRPFVCRTYTCVGDDRITQEMRDGTDPDF